MALLNLCIKFKNYFGQITFFEALRRHHLLEIFPTCPRVRQIQEIGQSEQKTLIFSKGTCKISKVLFNFSYYKFLARVESKIRKCLLFYRYLIIVKIQCGQCTYFGLGNHNCYLLQNQKSKEISIDQGLYFVTIIKTNEA